MNPEECDTDCKINEMQVPTFYDLERIRNSIIFVEASRSNFGDKLMLVAKLMHQLCYQHKLILVGEIIMLVRLLAC